MNRFAKALMVLLLLAALPLRGYAAVAAGLCDTRHDGDAASHAIAGDHADHHADASGKGEPGSGGSHSVCSHCATCTVGASLAPDAMRIAGFSPAGAAAIPFDGFAASGHVPAILDRPPLPL